MAQQPVLTFGTSPTFKVYVSDIGPVGPQGQPGDPGIQGPPGEVTINGVFDEHEFMATTDGEQAINLGVTPLVKGYRLFINGLRQSKSSYAVAGSTLVLPDTLGIETGDMIVFEYLT